jgi:CelD/BcsL family acetyltransferase involved in cellulose biosynthesis
MAIRELTFLSVPDTQMCDLVVSDDNVAAAGNAIVSTLRERQSDWDVLRLDYLPQRSRAATILGDAFGVQGFTCRIDANRHNPYISLDGTWDAFYANRSRRLKKANNLIANRLGKAGAVQIEWLAPGKGNLEDVARVTSIVTDISARSWKTSTGNSVDNPGPQAFIQRLSELAHRRGWLSVWILSLDHVPVAMEYQLVADGNVFALRSDFDAAVGGQASPGSYLSRHIIEGLFGRGLQRYFMGPGVNEYKYRWTEQAEPLHRMSVYGRSPRGRILQAWELSLKPAARALRDRFRKLDSAPAVPAGPDREAR